MDVIPFLKALGGVFAGLTWGAIGYAVARSKGEEFDSGKFGKTVLIGFILSGIAAGLQVDTLTVENYSMVQVITIVADKLWKAFEKPPKIG